MRSFLTFLTESEKNGDKFTKHEHEHEHIGYDGIGLPDFLNGPITEALSPEESQAMVDNKVKTPLKKMWEVYGPADAKPAPNRVLKERIEKRFAELAAMSPKERAAEYKAANDRMKYTKVGHPVSSNEKTDTAAEIPTKRGKNGQIPLGMSFAPDHAYHYTSPDATSKVHRNVCAGSTAACRSACLAKHGNYTFIANRAAIGMRTQRLTHNEKATADHATLVHQALALASKKATKEGKSVLIRGSVTDDTGHGIHSEAIKKHFPHVEQMGYTKIAGTPHDPKNGIHTIYSDSGPMVKKDAEGKLSLERENIQRRKVLMRATQGDKNRPGMNSYMVFNKKRPGASHGPDHPRTKQYKSFMEHLKTVRRYEPLPSAPEAGEKAEYHSAKGHGRIMHNGQSYRYQDHPVAEKIQDVHGNWKLPSEHDSRNADTSLGKYYNRNGHQVGHVVPAFATASTSNDDLHNSGFFHHTENVDEHGVYHDGHPAEMEAAGFKGVKHEGLVRARVAKEL